MKIRQIKNKQGIIVLWDIKTYVYTYLWTESKTMKKAIFHQDILQEFVLVFR